MGGRVMVFLYFLWALLILVIEYGLLSFSAHMLIIKGLTIETSIFAFIILADFGFDLYSKFWGLD